MNSEHPDESSTTGASEGQPNPVEKVPYFRGAEPASTPPTADTVQPTQVPYQSSPSHQVDAAPPSPAARVTSIVDKFIATAQKGSTGYSRNVAVIGWLNSVLALLVYLFKGNDFSDEGHSHIVRSINMAMTAVVVYIGMAIAVSVSLAAGEAGGAAVLLWIVLLAIWAGVSLLAACIHSRLREGGSAVPYYWVAAYGLVICWAFIGALTDSSVSPAFASSPWDDIVENYQRTTGILQPLTLIYILCRLHNVWNARTGRQPTSWKFPILPILSERS